MVVGIVDFEICFPSSRADVAEMHIASGLATTDIMDITHCATFPALGEYDQAWELTVDAARVLLNRARVPLSTIKQVIYSGSGEWDLPFWSPAAKVAAELGINDAHCFEVANFCNGGMAAIRVALDAITAGRTDHALVLIGDRLSRLVDYGDPESKALFNFGDAAAAVLLARDDFTFAVRHSAMRTDPSWADYYAGEIWDDRVLMRRRGHRRGLADAYVENFTTLVGSTLDALGRTTSDVAYFLMNQGDKSMHERLLPALDIPAERSVFNYHRLGHMGGADTLIALRDLLDEKRLSPGDLILLATSGMGFSWGITALEYQG
jgi:3-oxoacyl-[acyl-carrier-protein] synthase-3